MFSNNNNNNSTPFGGGGGGFGQPPNNNNNTFGTPGPTFGGAPAPTAFGAPQGGFGGFGAAPGPSMFGGAPSTNTGAFGAPAPSNFGGGAFGGGQQQSSGLFGGQQQAGGFGTQNAFGNSQPGAFGSNPAPAPFGAAPSTPFGAPAGGFGAPAPSAFGAPAPSAFGAPAPSMFGGNAPAPGTGFGTSTFQAPAPTGGGLFGAPAPAPSLFAGGTSSTTTSLFGAPAAAPTVGFGSTFGAPAAAPNTGLFGAPTPAPAAGGFGTTSTFGAPAMGGGGGGTKNVQFQATSKQDGGNSINFQTISAMSQFQTRCPEELRVEDYSQGFKGTSSGPTSGFSAATTPAPLFGSPSPAPGGFGSNFGAPAPTTGFLGSQPAPFGGSTFGAPAPSTFGAPAPSTFGAPAPSAFGAPAPSTFGAPAPSTFGAPAPSAFGAPAPSAFGAPAPGGFGSSGFGNPAPAPLFGSPTPAPAFGFGSSAPAPTGFGAAPSTFGAPAPSGGLFGQPAPAPTWGQPAPAPLFGQPAPATGGLFGNSAPAPSLFGQPAPAPSLFGQAAPTPSYGQQAAPPMYLNGQIIPPSSMETLNMNLEAIARQTEELKKQKMPWGTTQASSPSTTPTSIPERSPPLRPYVPRTPAARIVPRGFPSSAKKTPSTTSFLRRENNQLAKPDQHLQNSTLKLEIRPDSLQLALRDSDDHPSEDIDPAPTENSNNSGSRSKERALPPVSPAQEYYNQVVGNNTSPQAQPRNSTAVPSMERPDYEVSPSLEELAAMAPEDLATVKNFAISRPGYGMIEWEGQVDVRGADLDRIISIKPKDVSVYAIDEAEGTKPEEGTKLNRPAKITFYDVWPKSGPNAAKHIKERHCLRLEAKAKQMGAEFVSYDMDKGIWKFRVAHFSRYCLDEDWSDDDSLHRTPQYEMKQSMAMEVSDSEDVNEVETVINVKAEKAAYALLESMQRRSRVSPSSAATFDLDFGEIEGETNLEHYEEMIQVDYRNGSTSNVARPEVNAKDFVRGSFANVALSWTPSSKLWQANSHGKLEISSSAHKDKNEKELVLLLQTQLDCCEQVVLGGEGAPPLFTLKTSGPGEIVTEILPRFEAATDGDLRNAFSLISRLLPQPVSRGETEGYPYEERRVVAVREALGKLCSQDLPSSVGKSASLPMYALAGGAIRSASDLALGVVDKEAAVLLPATGHIAADPLAALMRMKSNEVTDWRHELATMICSHPDISLKHFVELVKQRVSDGTLTFADTRAQNAASHSLTPAFFFHLIQLFSNGKLENLRELFGPHGVAGSINDLASSFHIASVLLVSNDRWYLPDGTLEGIVEGFVQQLISCGLWHWAVFVTLYTIEGLSTKVQLEKAKSILLRFYDGNDAEKRDFLENKLGIPAVWLDEALCIRALQLGNLDDAVHYMMSYAPKEAIRLYDHSLLPKDFFVAADGYDNIRKNDDFTNISNSLVSSVRRFIDFEEDVINFLESDSKDKIRADELRGVHKELVNQFKHQGSVPLVIYKTTELTGKQVVAAVRERLGQIHKALLGVERDIGNDDMLML